MIEGIDVSSHQATTPSLTGKSFVIARATYGAHGDDHYLIHQIAVRNARKVFGAYHFSRPVSTGDTVAEQVRSFLLMAKDADLLFLDWETDGRNGRMAVADARAFIAAVHSAGRRIGLYASEASFRDLGQDFDWVANWSAQPKRHWDIWQYRGSPLDLDRFNGTVSQLRALGEGPLPESSTEEPVLEYTHVDGQRDSGPGTVTVAEDKVSYIRPDGTTSPLAKGITKHTYGLVRFKPGGKWPGEFAYLIGADGAFLLRRNTGTSYKPDAAGDATAIATAVKAAKAKTSSDAAAIVASDAATTVEKIKQLGA